MEIKAFSCNLNIYYDVTDYIWDKVVKAYKIMPKWKGFIDGFEFVYEFDEKV